MNLKNEFWENKLPIGFYDDLYTSGQDKKTGLQSNWHHISFLKIKKYIEKTDFHLDYACGPGTFIGNYLDCTSIGYDIAENQIIYANNKYSSDSKSFTSVIKNLSKDKPFDIITVMGLIEVLTEEEFKSELNFLLSILQPKGKIVFVTPNYGGAMYFLEKISNVFNSVNYKEVKTSYYSRKKIIKFMNSNFHNCNINFEVKCILNFGILLSILSKKYAIILENKIESFFSNFFGFLLVLEIKNNAIK